jgi:hypothetical protein
LPAEPDPDETLAAEEIKANVRRMSGVALPVAGPAGVTEEGPAPIYIGAAAEAKLEDMIRQKGDDPAAFALVVVGDRASIRGLSPEGTLFGAYELLEQLGVRWFLTASLDGPIIDLMGFELWSGCEALAMCLAQSTGVSVAANVRDVWYWTFLQEVSHGAAIADVRVVTWCGDC